MLWTRASQRPTPHDRTRHEGRPDADAVDSRLAKTNTGGLPILGRALQIIGLILVPVAVAGNLAEIAHAPVALSLGESLLVSVIGISLFYLGWLLNNRGSRV
jgi:hypothetical protein